jgi:hypothetical protein
MPISCLLELEGWRGCSEVRKCLGHDQGIVSHLGLSGLLGLSIQAAYSGAYGAWGEGEGCIYHSLTELFKENGGGGILMIFNIKTQHMVMLIQNRSPGEQRHLKRSVINQYMFSSKTGTLTAIL